MLLQVNSFFDDNLIDQIEYLVSNKIVVEDNIDVEKINSKFSSKDYSTVFNKLANEILLENIHDIFDGIEARNRSVIFIDHSTIKSSDINEIINNISITHINKYFKSY